MEFEGLESRLVATAHPHRVLTITAIAQLLVLGCTWSFGLFLFNPHSLWLSYIFTLLNCLQGLFLYVMLCLLNKKVGRPEPAMGRAQGGGREEGPALGPKPSSFLPANLALWLIGEGRIP